MKKHKLYHLLIALSLTGIASNAQTTNLLVKLKQGSDILIKSSELKTITFKNDVSTFLLNDWSSKEIPSSNIMSMRFITLIDALTAVKGNTQLKLYPNPTNGLIYFSQLEKSSNSLHIYNLNGVQIFSATLSQSVSSMDVSFLKQGVYIVKINNTTTRLIKL